jgi:hypothetical protein
VKTLLRPWLGRLCNNLKLRPFHKESYNNNNNNNNIIIIIIIIVRVMVIIMTAETEKPSAKGFSKGYFYQQN